MPQTPDDPTKAQAWVTKNGDDLDFEFYFPQGPKGDPGGFANFTNLGNANLNDFKSNGIYKQTNGGYSTLLNNYPVAGGIGTLMVANSQDDTSRLEQTWTRIDSNFNVASKAFWKRSFYTDSPGWSPWRCYSSQRVDQAAGRTIYTWDDVNSREQLTYGDTGWRNIRSLFESVCAANGLTFALKSGFTDPAIRRIGSTIHYRIGVSITGANIATTDFRSAMQPPGFKADQIENWQIPASVTGSAGVIHFAPNSWIRFWTAGEQVFVKSLSTSDAWPTTLPGTAIGTIPNL